MKKIKSEQSSREEQQNDWNKLKKTVQERGAFAKEINFPNLCLGHNAQEKIFNLIKLNKNAEIKEINLSACELSDKTASALIQMLKQHQELTKITVKFDKVSKPIQIQIEKMLITHKQNNYLKSLNQSSYNYSYSNNPTKITLEIEEWCLTDTYFYGTVLAKTKDLSTISTLKITQNKNILFKDTNCEVNSLAKLHGSENQYENLSAFLLQNKKVSQLIFEKIDINTPALSSLIRSIANKVSLTELGYIECYKTKGGSNQIAICVSNTLKNTPFISLKKIYFEKMNFTADILAAYLGLLINNTHLMELNFGSILDKEKHAKLMDLLERNSYLATISTYYSECRKTHLMGDLIKKHGFLEKYFSGILHNSGESHYINVSSNISLKKENTLYIHLNWLNLNAYKQSLQTQLSNNKNITEIILTAGNSYAHVRIEKSVYEEVQKLLNNFRKIKSFVIKDCLTNISTIESFVKDILKFNYMNLESLEFIDCFQDKNALHTLLKFFIELFKKIQKMNIKKFSFSASFLTDPDCDLLYELANSNCSLYEAILYDHTLSMDVLVNFYDILKSNQQKNSSNNPRIHIINYHEYLAGSKTSDELINDAFSNPNINAIHCYGKTTKHIDENLVQTLGKILQYHANIVAIEFDNITLSYSALDLILKSLLQNPKPTLTKLCLDFVSLTDECLQLILDFLKKPPQGLHTLSLMDNKLTNNGIVRLTKELTVNSHGIAVLKLGGNEFNQQGLNQIETMLQKNKTLCHINLVRNQFKPEAIKQFLVNIKLNRTIVKLEISHVEHGFEVFLNSSHYPQNYPYIENRNNTYYFNTDANIECKRKQLNLNPIQLKLLENISSKRASFWVSEAEHPELYTDLKNFHKPSNNSYGYFKSYTKKDVKDGMGKFLQRNIKLASEALLAAFQDEVKKIDELLKQGVSLYTFDPNDPETQTMLHQAINNEKLAVIQYLMEQNFNVHILNNNSITCYELAIGKKNPKILTEISNVPLQQIPLISPQESNITSNESSQVITVSPTIKKLKIEKLPENVNYELFYAACNGDLNKISIQLPIINYSPIGLYGQTLLHGAAQYGQNKIVTYLLDNQLVNINQTDAEGRTALHLACLYPINIDTLNTLIKNGADLDCQDKQGATPLLYLCGGFIKSSIGSNQIKLTSQLIYMLIHAGADANIQYFDFQSGIDKITVLHKAVQNNEFKFVNALLSSTKINPNLQDIQGNTPLHWALIFKNLNIIKRLLSEPHIKLDIQNNAGKTPLQLAQELDNNFPDKMHIITELSSNYTRLDCRGGIHWTNNFIMYYKDLKFDAAPQHALLAQQIQNNKNTEKNKVLQNRGNTAAASLMFITSNSADKHLVKHTHQAIEIHLNFVDQTVHTMDAFVKKDQVQGKDPTSNFTVKRDRSPEFRDNIIGRLKATPPDLKMECTDDIRVTTQPLSEKGIQEIYETAKPKAPAKSFEELFHHSEQALADHLCKPQTIQKIVSSFINTSEFKQGFTKVKAIILNINSTYYMCYNCEVTLAGLQNPTDSPFLNPLKDELQNQGCILSKNTPLTLTTFFSSGIPCSGRSAQTQDNHVNYHIDLRTIYKTPGLIFHQDTTAKPSGTTFVSSRPFSFGKKN